MLKSIRNSLYLSMMASAPLLLSACGTQNDPPPKFEIVLVPLLLIAVSFVFRRLKAQALPACGAA